MLDSVGDENTENHNITLGTEAKTSPATFTQGNSTDAASFNTKKDDGVFNDPRRTRRNRRIPQARAQRAARVTAPKTARPVHPRG